MKILMVSSECVPYAKSGGLADVVAALSRQLYVSGHDVRILNPGYSFLEFKKSETANDKRDVAMSLK